MSFIVKYFRLLFNFQGVTSFAYRNGRLREWTLLKIANSIFPAFAMLIFVTYVNLNTHRVHEIVKVEKNLKVSISLRLISKFFFYSQQVISILIVALLYKKQSAIVKCFDLCLKIKRKCQIDLKVIDVKTYLILYAIFEVSLIANILISFFGTMRVTTESFVLFCMMNWSSNISCYVVLLTVFFNKFIFILMDKCFELNDVEKTGSMLLHIDALTKSFQLAYGVISILGAIQMFIIILVLVTVIVEFN